MADLPVKEAEKFNEAKEAKVEEPKGPRIIEGNTGTLTVMLLNDISLKLSQILSFVEDIKKEKV